MSNSLSHSGKHSIIILAFASLVMFLSLAADAQESYHLVYALNEVGTDRNITNVTLKINEKNILTGKELSITEYLNTNMASIYLNSGEYELVFIADEAQTEGKDYYAFEKFTVSESNKEIIYLFPIASIRGTVVDKLDNLLEGAEIKLNCDKDFMPIEQIKTDKFGAFTIQAVPTGNCIITASYKDSFEQQHLAFNRGDFEAIRLKLEDETTSSSLDSSFTLFAMIILLAIFAAGLAYWFFVRHESAFQVKEPAALEKIEPQQRNNNRLSRRIAKKPKESSLPQRVKHILPTLNNRERLVVQFLLDNNGISTQGKIRHGTQIPKTSLIRILDSLRSRKIVSIDVTDVSKSIKLSSWFMQK